MLYKEEKSLLTDTHMCSFSHSDASVLENHHQHIPLFDPFYIPLVLRILEMHRTDCNAVIISLLKAFFEAINKGELVCRDT